MPLQGVAADFDRAPAITVMVGGRPDAHVTREVRDPVQLAIEQTEAGAVSALHVRSGDGTTTTVAFRSPMRPEEVDGLDFPRPVP